MEGESSADRQYIKKKLPYAFCVCVGGFLGVHRVVFRGIVQEQASPRVATFVETAERHERLGPRRAKPRIESKT
jgi:hypothetical protein